MKPEITCVIPAYNEGEGIYETIIEIDKNVPPGSTFSIFVSEDGSTDDTRSEVLRASQHVTNCKVLLSSPSGRLGYSRAVQRGIRECSTELICFMDADGQCDPRDIKLIVDEMENGVVVGYRNPRKDGINRILYSKCFGFVYRLLGGPKRRDASSPMIVARTSEIESLGLIDFHLSFGFWWEFQWRIQSLGIKVKEVPVNHRERIAGITQVYTLKKLPKIVSTHLRGLLALRREIRGVSKN